MIRWLKLARLIKFCKSKYVRVSPSLSGLSHFISEAFFTGVSMQKRGALLTSKGSRQLRRARMYLHRSSTLFLTRNRRKKRHEFCGQKVRMLFMRTL